MVRSAAGQQKRLGSGLGPPADKVPRALRPDRLRVLYARFHCEDVADSLSARPRVAAAELELPGEHKRTDVKIVRMGSTLRVRLDGRLTHGKAVSAQFSLELFACHGRLHIVRSGRSANDPCHGLSPSEQACILADFHAAAPRMA